MYAGAVVHWQRRVFRLYHLQHLLAIHGLGRFTLLGLAEANGYDVRHILLLRELDVQLLDAGHLVVVEPVRSLLLAQLIEHLGIELLVVDFPYIIYILPLRNLDADVAAAACGIRQGMG